MTITTMAAGKPTIVLVHGAFAESASWNGVIASLLDDGYPALAVANPLRGVRSDSDYTRTGITRSSRRTRPPARPQPWP